LVKTGAKVDQLNNKNETPLMVAVKYGYFRSAQALLECGADVFYTTPDGISLFDVCKNSKELFIPMLNSFQQKQARPK
jgi:hypothetical protein